MVHSTEHQGGHSPKLCPQGALSSGTPPASARHTHPSPRLDHTADSASTRRDRAQGEGHRPAAPKTQDSPAVQPPAGRLPRGRGGPAPFLMFSLQSLSSDASEPALTALLISKWTRISPCLASRPASAHRELQAQVKSQESAHDCSSPALQLLQGIQWPWMRVPELRLQWGP